MDIHEKQKNTKFWDQDKIEKCIPLVLGVGGIGSNCALSLIRLGVKKMYILDFDKVEIHNLNRQILYSKDNINKYKVDCSKKVLDEFHNTNNCEIISLNIDAVKEWNKLVEIAKDSTCIFNGIDVGDYFDLAISSLGYKLQIPVINGGTDPMTGLLTMIDFLYPNGPCFNCISDLKNKEIIQKLNPNNILNYKNISFISYDIHYENGGSMVYSCIIGSNLMVSIMCDYILKINKQIPNRFILSYITYDLEKWIIPKKEKCEICN
jgi:molybdopterin/thiamine biosynthesis adenylyltransferase